MSRRGRDAAGRHVGLALAVLALTACGTTVPQQALQSGAGDPVGTLGEPGLALPDAPDDPLGSSLVHDSDTNVEGSSPSGTPSSSGSGQQTSRDAPAAVAAPSSGGDGRVTAPLTIGILAPTSANEVAAAIGANYSTTASAQDVTRALVRHYNKRGGMAGRQLRVVEHNVNPASPSYVTEYQAACEKFTQDNKVSLVLSVHANSYFENYEQCLLKAGVPDIAGFTGGTDEEDLRKYPTLVSLTAPSTNRRFTAMIKGFVDQGYLTPRNRIGVVVEACPYNNRTFTRTVEPLVVEHRLTIERRDIDCATGASDLGNYSSGVQSAVLAFRSAGVDRVMFMSNFEGLALLNFENNAQSQGYTPAYALTSTTGGASLTAQFSSSQLERIRGVGWTPVLDITARVHASSATKRCRDALAAEGVQPQNKNDDLLDIVCDQFFFVESVLKRTGGHADGATFLSAVAALGNSYLSAYTLTGASRFGQGRRDGPQLFAVWSYGVSCGCFSYVTKPAPLA